MAELQVKDIENGNILPTDKVYAFSEDESKAPTIDALVKSTPGIIALGVCKTEAAEGYKQVTSSNWKGVPGESILIEFAETNSAKAVYISINEGTTLPVYPLNSNVIAAGSVIHSGAMLFTLSSDGTKLWAIVIALKTFDNQELAGSGNIDLGYYLDPIVNSIPTKVSDLQNDKGFVSSVPTKLSDLENDKGFITGSDNVESATKLKTARTIAITDADGTNSGTSISFNGTEDKTLKLPSTIKANITGNSTTATTSAHLGMDGNSNIPMTFHWEGQSGEPVWLWGSNNGYDAYVYRPANIDVHRAAIADNATTAYKIRTSAPENPEDGDIWLG